MRVCLCVCVSVSVCVSACVCVCVCVCLIFSFLFFFWAGVALQMPVARQLELLQTTTTLYVGNLSFFTTEEQVHALFSRAGEVRRVIMGINRLEQTPCGFCFVECVRRADALACIRYLHGAVLDDRVIRVAMDRGWEEGRQYGRGRTGRQVRDEQRGYFDSARGGWGTRTGDDNGERSNGYKRARANDGDDEEDGRSYRRHRSDADAYVR
jgi:nuclear cap-binding protein subunit 2